MNEHTETYRIRHDECDAYGVLNNAAYLRLAQETGWRHSVAAGFDLEYYSGLQRVWIARDTEIEYLRPLTYGDVVEVTTRVPSARRALARRTYDFRLADEPVARAQTDWVFLDVVRGVPASIPDEIVESTFTGASAVPRLKREPFPTPPAAPAGAVDWERQVEWRDVDPYGHLNNAIYLSYTQEAAIAAGEAYGVTHETTLEDGLGWTLKRSRIEYLIPALPADRLRVVTWLSPLRRASAVRHYSIVHDDQEIARAESLWLTVDLITGKPRRLPPWMREALAPNVGKPLRGGSGEPSGTQEQSADLR